MHPIRLAQKGLDSGWGSRHVDDSPRLCMASAVGGYLTSFGKEEPIRTYGDIDNANCLFIIGFNTIEANPILLRRIARRKQMESTVKIIVAGYRRTNTSRIVDVHISFRSGTELAMSNFMALVTINEELYSRCF